MLLGRVQVEAGATPNEMNDNDSEGCHMHIIKLKFQLFRSGRYEIDNQIKFSDI